MLARDGFVQGIVFAPLNKHSLRLAGMQEEDELRFMQGLFDVRGFVCEFNITGALWTSRVTSRPCSLTQGRSIRWFSTWW